MNKILLVLSIALLSGCSTEVVPPSKAKLAPANQLYKFQETNPNDGVLTVVRDSGFISAGCAASLYINGGLAPIFPYTFYHLTHYWFAAADIPVANDTPVHYADAIRCNVRRPPQGSLPLLTRRVSA